MLRKIEVLREQCMACAIGYMHGRDIMCNEVMATSSSQRSPGTLLIICRERRWEYDPLSPRVTLNCCFRASSRLTTFPIISLPKLICTGLLSASHHGQRTSEGSPLFPLRKQSPYLAVIRPPAYSSVSSKATFMYPSRHVSSPGIRSHSARCCEQP